MADVSGHDSGAELTLQPTEPAASLVRRRALWGVLAVVALVTGGVVVASNDDEGPPQLPVSLGGFGAEADAAGAASMSRAAWVTYVAGPDLPALGGRAAAFKVVPDVDEAAVRRLGVALGLVGEPVREDGAWLLRDGDKMLQVDERGGSWWYSAASGEVSVSETSGSGSGAEPGEAPDAKCAADGPDCDLVAPDECPPNARCTHAVGGGTEPVEPITLPAPVDPTPPADLPNEAEARQIALDLITAAGQDVSDAKVTAEGPHDAWYVMIEHRVDGVLASGFASSVSVGSEGEVLHASGWLADVERLGDYPLIDTRAAIDRLNDLQNGFDGGPVPLGTDDRDTGVAVEPAPGDDDLYDPVMPDTVPPEQPICKVQPDGREICELIAEGEPLPECPPDADCLGWSPYPCEDTPVVTVPDAELSDPAIARSSDIAASCTSPEEPYEQPAPVEVVLHDAEAILTMQWANDGSADVYLLPGYRFSGDDGAIVEVAAVDDDSLAPVDSPDAPAPGEPEPDEPSVDPLTLEPGQEPELGVGYYVDVNTHCGWFTFADRWWATDENTPLRGWAEPTEGGTFTLETADEGVFVGDAEGTKTARFTAKGPAAELPPCD